ncbi:SAM-dependent methyltransferase [Nonomuraea fuscirosea]
MTNPEPGGSPSTIDTTTAHSARIWDWLLGGKDHYAVDREVGEAICRMSPALPRTAREDRAFLRRAVDYLVREAGIRQFLDIGTGLPTADNTHEVAQRLAPDARVVYVDNDPVVLAHAKALLVGASPGTTAYLDADLRDPDTILREAAKTLDFTRPIAIMLLGIVHFIPSDDEAHAIIEHLLNSVPSGSHLALVHITAVFEPEAKRAEVQHWNEHGKPNTLTIRTPEQIEGLFRGLDILPPGIVPTPLWRPDIADAPPVDGFCGVGSKP